MSELMSKKRAYLMAILLGLLVFGLYFGFMWLVATGEL